MAFAGMAIGSLAVAIAYKGIASLQLTNVGTIAAVWVSTATAVGLPFSYFLVNFRQEATVEVHPNGVRLNGKVWGEPGIRTWTWPQTTIEPRDNAHSDDGGSSGPRLILRHVQWGRIVVAPCDPSTFDPLVLAIRRAGGHI